MAAETTKKYAVVTGGNKGIGFEICKQLASNGITVIVTARDEKKGLQAVEILKDCGLSDNIVFHTLDVTDQTSISYLANFVKTHFGKLDILVNNAGTAGAALDAESLRAAALEELSEINFEEVVADYTYELAEECFQTNYYGAKRMCEAFIPLLELSDSPRIVNVSSIMGKLENVSNKWAKEVLSDAENLTEEKVDGVLSAYLKDFEEGSLIRSKDWPAFFAPYILSKAAMNAYTRILSKKYSSLFINSVRPGFVKTDISFNVGVLSPKEGAESVVKLALLCTGCPSGVFFNRKEESLF